MNYIDSRDSFDCRRKLPIADEIFEFYCISELVVESRLPYTLRILAENVVRHECGRSVVADDIRALTSWRGGGADSREILFHPNRLIMHDTTCTPALVDLAALRDAVNSTGGDPRLVNPCLPVDLVIDHSVAVDAFGTANAVAENTEREIVRNRERYSFIRWAETALENFRVVPPGTGIIHSVNLEYLSPVVWTSRERPQPVVYPDTSLGTDSHTPMINGLGVLGWGIGGIEAEAIMLGQPVAMRVPDVIGFRLEGKLPAGATTSDLVLTITERLRAEKVVGKFIEFFGDGLDYLNVPDRATIANMAPEYGATVCYFPIDGRTLSYLRGTGRDEAQVAIVEAYARAQGLWRTLDDSLTPIYPNVLSLDLATVEPSVAGPGRPQDRVPLNQVATAFAETFTADSGDPTSRVEDGLEDGDVVLAAITSCTTTANPDLMVAAGLLARKAVERGLSVVPWVKTSLAPGSRVVADYLSQAGLQPFLDKLGFNVVGFGCTTCIGNSGPLIPDVAKEVEARRLTVAAVVSSNRNFPGRVHPQTKATYLASPALVVAYALAGTIRRDLSCEPLGIGKDGNKIYLSDIWPSRDEVQAIVESALTPELFRETYTHVFEGDARWRELTAKTSVTFPWDPGSVNLRRPPFLDGIAALPPPPADITDARILALFGDDVTTDDLSSAGAIASGSPAAEYLRKQGVTAGNLNVYASYRGNFEVMKRAALANGGLRNEMAGRTGPFTRCHPDGTVLPVFDVAQRYAQEGKPLVIIGGRAFGCGSSRDWAAKGIKLLGVRAVVAESFERIHRTNLIGMGLFPLQFPVGTTRRSLELDGSEKLEICGIAEALDAGEPLLMRVTRASGEQLETPLDLRVETELEVHYLRHGGVLPAVFRGLMTGSAETRP